METFDQVLSDWKTAALKLAEAETAYERAFAEAISKAEGKNAEQRQAAAKVAVEAERQKRDLARIEEEAAKWRLKYRVTHDVEAAA